MKKVKVQYTLNNMRYEATFNLKTDCPKALILAKEASFIEAVKSKHEGATDVELMVELSNPPISKKKLLEVGTEVAAGWGAECTSVKAYKSHVVFNCIECGERFTTTLTYDDIKSDYAYCL